MTTPNTTEKAFEQAIEDALLAAGYGKRRPEDYDRTFCLDPGAVLDFIYATQPREWEKYRKQHGEGAKQKLFHRIASEVKARGTLDVLIRRKPWVEFEDLPLQHAAEQVGGFVAAPRQCF